MRKARRLLREGEVNFCYVDESGTGDQPIAVMVGVIVDSLRMHVTKADWESLLGLLGRLTGRQIVELHTADFYAGNGVWRELAAETRVAVFDAVLTWLAERKHHIVYTSVTKAPFIQAVREGAIPSEINTPWRFMAFHLALSVQRYSQPEKNNKGHTLLVFDNEERERMRLSEVIATPPVWSDEYYSRAKKQKQLDQIVDVPYWGDSKEVGLLQLADFLVFLLRRYAELEAGSAARYPEEKERMSRWVERMKERRIDVSHIYPRRQRNPAQDLFYDYAPESIRRL